MNTKRPFYPHPSIYNIWHHLQFMLLPAPIRYTPTHAPCYWIDRDYPKGTITRLIEPPPFPLTKAVVNGYYEIDCLMVGPGVLVLRTPTQQEYKTWFYNVDFEQIFGHSGLGVCANFPIEYIPNSLLLATGVEYGDATWEPSQAAKERWATKCMS